VARAALRQFRAQGRGTLILGSSLLAHIVAPYMSAYVTAKWGQRGLARALRQEVRDAPDIHICTLVPGSVDTSIYTSAANYAGFVGRPPPPVDSAERMASAILSLAERPRFVKSVGLTNRLVEFGFAAFPPVYDALVGPMMRHLGLSRTRTDPGTGNVFQPAPRVEGGPLRITRAQAGGVLGGVVVSIGAAALALRRVAR
jgi:short-subunit dehydrogenase